MSIFQEGVEEAEDQVFAAVNFMVSAVTERPDITILDLAAELIATMEDRPVELKLLMMATSYAAALKIIAAQPSSEPTRRGN